MKRIRITTVLVTITIGLTLLLFVKAGVSSAGVSEPRVYLPSVLQTFPLDPELAYITAFEANTPLADPGATITLSWQTAQAVTVTLFRLLPTGQLGSSWDVALSGSMTYTIADWERNASRFMLYAGHKNATWVWDSLTVLLTCPDTWFFTPAPDECPAVSPLYSAGAEQHFERGVMIWVGSLDQIFVLFADEQYPRWKSFPDNWTEGDPINDPGIMPPPGYFQPLRGFGLVWRDEPGVRDRLGWGVDTETGLETAWQVTSRSRYNDIYIRALDGNVWRLLPEGSAWVKVMSDE